MPPLSAGSWRLAHGITWRYRARLVLSHSREGRVSGRQSGWIGAKWTIMPATIPASILGAVLHALHEHGDTTPIQRVQDCP
jgi:hypothetical protein